MIWISTLEKETWGANLFRIIAKNRKVGKCHCISYTSLTYRSGTYMSFLYIMVFCNSRIFTMIFFQQSTYWISKFWKLIYLLNPENLETWVDTGYSLEYSTERTHNKVRSIWIQNWAVPFLRCVLAHARKVVSK